MGLWDLLSTDPIGKWMSWFCGGNPFPSESTRFFKSCTDICIPTTPANKLELTAASQYMVSVFTRAVMLPQTVFGADMEDKERKKTQKQSVESEAIRFNSLPIQFLGFLNFRSYLRTPVLYFIQSLPIPRTH